MNDTTPAPRPPNNGGGNNGGGGGGGNGGGSSTPPANRAPEFDANAPTSLNVVENTEAGVDIGTPYTATDPDGDTPLTYSLGGTDAASFDIDATSGQIKTKATLDFETKETYTVRAGNATARPRVAPPAHGDHR